MAHIHIPKCRQPALWWYISPYGNNPTPFGSRGVEIAPKILLIEGGGGYIRISHPENGPRNLVGLGG